MAGSSFGTFAHWRLGVNEEEEEAVMAVEMKRRVIVLGAFAASRHLLSIIMNMESDSDSENEEEFVQLMNLERNMKIRGKLKKGVRIEGFVKNIITRFNGKQFKEHFRMSFTVFENLENKLGDMLIRQTARGRLRVPVRKQLLATLWLLATPDSYRSVGSKFDLGKSSLMHCVRRVIKSLNLISAEVISWPRGDSLLRVKEKFQRISKLPDVVGAIDGSHIEIPAPEVDSEAYNTRKCRYAVVLQAVCDADLRFIDCFAGYPGSVGDLRVFRNSDLWHAVHGDKNNFFPNEEFIIGDKAYPVLRWCLPPYKDNGHLTNVQIQFNIALSKSRQVIERAFALLKGRFRRLKYLHTSRVDLIPQTILACCVLHNICLDLDEDIENDMFNVEGINEDIDIENNDNILHAEGDIEGFHKRDYIAQTLHVLH